MISVRLVGKRYGRLTALDGVSFDAPRGQVLGLLGQNGAGKTSLLNIMSGYLPPSSGTVTVNGHDLLKEPLKAKSDIGYLPEVPPLYPEMSVLEYLRFCCDLKGVAKKEQKAHIDELVQLCGLSPVAARLSGLLSKGYKQRLGLAQALCGGPEVLLLDEPTAGFDPVQTAEFRSIISSLSKKHTIVFSTHILSEVQAICDRVIIIHEGKLIFDRNLADPSSAQTASFHIRVKRESNQLLPALRGLPSAIRVTPHHAGEKGMTDAVVETRLHAPFQEELFSLLSGLQAPILLLNPLQDSIEDVFLRVTANDRLREPVA